MRFINNMSVAKRLTLSFGLIVGLLAGVCVLGFMNALRSERLIDQTLVPAQSRYEIATNLLENALRQDVAIRNVGLSEDPAVMQREEAGIKKLDQQIRAEIETLANLVVAEQDRADIEKVRAIGARAVPQFSKALSLALAFAPADAIAVLNQHVAPLSVERTATLVQFAERQRQGVVQTATGIKEAGATARMLLGLCGAAGIVIAALCAWVVTRSVTVPLAGAVRLADRVAEGDLVVVLDETGCNRRFDEIGRFQAALDRMAEGLRSSIGAIRTSSQSVMMASSEIAAGNQDLSNRTEQQSALLQQNSSTLQQLTASVSQSADAAREAASVAQEAAAVAEEGGRRLERMVSTMGDISSSSRRISEIVGVIDGIAFQTNILALNASVEAARAGEQGRGFSVVASEVRSLAQRSSAAAAEIKALITANVETVAAGSEVADQTQRAMTGILTSGRRLSALLGEISASTAQQSGGVQQASEALSKIDQAVQQNAALVEQSAAAAQSLREQSRSLNEAVARFRLGGEPQPV